MLSPGCGPFAPKLDDLRPNCDSESWDNNELARLRVPDGSEDDAAAAAVESR